MDARNRTSRSPVRFLVWLNLLFVLAAAVGTLGLALSGCELTSNTVPVANYWQLLSLVVALAFAILGALIVHYRPDNRIGRLCGLIGFTMALNTLSDAYTQCSLAGDVALPPNAIMIWLAYVTPILAITLILTLLPFWYPDGQFLSPNWRRAALVLYALLGCATLLITLIPGPMIDNGVDVSFAADNPLGLRFLPTDWAPGIRQVLALGLVITCFTAIASLVLRWRRSTGDTRQQIKWFAYFLATAVSLQMVIELYGEFVNSAIFDSALNMLAISVVLLGFPLVVGIAVFRYRLYDIDLIIRKTVVYAILTVLLALIYFGIVILLQSIVESVSGQQSPIIIVVSTLIIAALFAPLRRRVQDFIDRRFYRRRYDAAKTLADFADFVRDETDMEALSAELLRVTEETMQPDQVSVWLKQPTGTSQLER